jgi:hypothetical protein
MNELIALIPKLVSIFALAFVSSWGAVILGFALGVNPIVTWATCALSYASGVVLVAALGQPIRERLMARFGSKSVADPDSRIRRVWKRYGLLGLSLIAPLTTGAQIGAALGLSLGIPPRKLVIGMSLAGAVWVTLAIIAVMLGIVGTQAIR